MCEVIYLIGDDFCPHILCIFMWNGTGMDANNQASTLCQVVGKFDWPDRRE